MANKKYRDLENRLDRVTAAFLVGKALLDSYIAMGQPGESLSGHSPAAQPAVRIDSTNYAAFPPHERYGNIYYPYHVMQVAGLRYQIVDEQGALIVPDISWSKATELARLLNEQAEMEVRQK